jgi:uncharacterized membrane protein (UPF0127 family)
MAGGFLLLQFKGNITPSSSIQSPHVIINNHVIAVEIADEFNEWQQGLSDRKILAENEGMLFVFPDKQVRCFWMKNMNFALDIIWLDDNLPAQTGKIIKIDKDAQPEGEKPSRRYSSMVPINYVLEVNAGWCDKYNIKVGNEVKFNLEN